MIDDLVQKSDFATGENITVSDIENIKFEDAKSIAQVILPWKTSQMRDQNWWKH